MRVLVGCRTQLAGLHAQSERESISTAKCGWGSERLGGMCVKVGYCSVQSDFVGRGTSARAQGRGGGGGGGAGS